MKSIELTKEHKSKLLEMCKVLFSNKYPFFRIKKNNLLIFDQDIYNKVKLELGIEFEEILLLDNEASETIHWFEFCMTHLAPKICDGKTYYIFCDRCNSHKIDSKEFSKEFISKYLQHPVDYLYDEFKKLKL